MAYTKLFNSILTSTIWMEDDQTRIVWITMLAMADKNGEVQGSIPGIARVAGVTLDDCNRAIKRLTSPDPYSRTKDDEGRRIEEIEGGWALINHGKYRDMASREDSKDAAAKRQARVRERKKRSKLVTPESRSVTHSHALVTDNVHIADADLYNTASGFNTVDQLSEELMDNLEAAGLKTSEANKMRRELRRATK
jgi:hypothetical protein